MLIELPTWILSSTEAALDNRAKDLNDILEPSSKKLTKLVAPPNFTRPVADTPLPNLANDLIEQLDPR
jgi:hypothetical protein